MDSGSTVNLKLRSRTTPFKTLRRSRFKSVNTTTETLVATTRAHHQIVHTLQTTSSPTTLEHATPFGCTVAILTALLSTFSHHLQPSSTTPLQTTQVTVSESRVRLLTFNATPSKQVNLLRTSRTLTINTDRSMVRLVTSLVTHGPMQPRSTTSLNLV